MAVTHITINKKPDDPSSQPPQAKLSDPLQAVLEIDGQLYMDWESVTVKCQVQVHPYYTFRFTCSEGMPLSKNFAALRIRPGDFCQVTLAGEAVVLGFVNTRQVFYDSRRHYIEIQGASNVQGLAYAGAISKTGEHKDVTYEQYARALLKPFSPKINFVVQGGQLPQIKFPRISIPHGMSVLEALEIPLRSLGGVSLTSNPKGDLVAIVGASGGEDTVVEGKNILEGREIIYSNAIATSDYVPGQGPGSDRKFGAQVTRGLGTNAVTGFVNRYMPGVVPHDMPTSDDSHLKGRANMERDIMLEDEVTVFATVHGWVRPSGGLWKPRQVVRVISPMLIMDGSEKLEAKSVTFSQDNERGSRTVLELCNQKAMGPGVPHTPTTGG